MTLAKYLLVGVLNTAVGFGLIFTLMFLGFSPLLANALGYAFGIVFSYFLNSIFTFKAKKKSLSGLVKFILAMGLAWLVNAGVLELALSLKMNPYLAQVLAGLSYTASGYLLSKFVVFR